MTRIPTRDIRVSISYLDLRVSLTAEGCSWSPDVAADMVNRMENLWHSALLGAATFGLIQLEDDEEFDEDTAEIEAELLDRNTVHFDDGEHDG